MKEIKDINQNFEDLEEEHKCKTSELEQCQNLEEQIIENGNKNEDISQILDKDTFHSKIKKSKDAVKKDKSPQKKLWSFIFIVLNVVIVVAILLGMLEQDNYTPLSGISFNYWWCFIALLAFIALIVIDQLRFHLLIKKSTGMNRLNLSYKVSALGKYYDFITPLSTGGQPFQAYYLSTRGIKASHSVSIPIAKYIAQQIVFSLFSLVILILSYTGLRTLIPFDDNFASIVLVASWIGFACNFLLVVLVIFLSVGSFGKKTVLGILKLLHKIKLVKNYDEKYTKILDIVDEYQRTVKFFIKSPWLLIKMIFTTLLYLLVQFSTPFFVYCAFGFEPTLEMWGTCICVALLIELAASFVPLPGGSGVAELSFTAMFASSFAGASFWALLFWRCLTYYGFIIQGILIILYDAFIGNKKNKKHLPILKEKYPSYYETAHNNLESAELKTIDEIELEIKDENNENSNI